MTTTSVEQVKLAKIDLQSNIYRLLEKFTADNGVSVSDLRLSVYKASTFDNNYREKRRYYYEVEVKVNL